ncbi:hypothetical protein [Cylindrospermopsis raciborskii]|jgi:hypothetical protein|uniref:hypothetical protein n=1 Tax=Cylindrospermopsis raciborskii TaxID=77022 RepID=UPI001F2CD62B|nr:hypothetical protein [Cylindrospermopsis raciborskii]UJS06238.1 hypothetical protein L3I90_08535 [Cylindrospermopsis raciborskii KLL07]
MLNSDGKRFPSKDKSVISMLLGYLPGDRLWESSLLPSQWKILNMRTGDRTSDSSQGKILNVLRGDRITLPMGEPS